MGDYIVAPPVLRVRNYANKCGNSFRSGMLGLCVTRMLMDTRGAFGPFLIPRVLEQENNEEGKGT